MLPHALSNLLFVERFYRYPVVASTNDTARMMTEYPDKGIFVIQADRQTYGRGRSGASYFSGEGGLWVTILARLPSVDDHFRHNRSLSLAIAEAAESMAGLPDLSISIKWPNDLYAAGKKLCGILLENHPSAVDMLVLGFGLNVTMVTDDFPADVRPGATSLSIETGKRVSRSCLLEAIIRRYESNRGADAAVMHESYLKRLYRRGDRAEADGREGIVDGVEPDGRLRLAGDREVHFVHAGHLRFLDVPGSVPDAP